MSSFHEINRSQVDFLKADLEIALTFSRIALEAEDPQKKSRNRQLARRAYDSIVRLRPRVALESEDIRILESDLQELRNNLVSLGEVF